MHEVKVYRGKHTDRGNLFGPLPGCRHGNVVAYEFELPKTFEPWPGRSRLERTFVVLDLGISFANPCWRRWHRPDGRIGTNEPEGRDSWYVDLISVESVADAYTFLDLYIDAVTGRRSGPTLIGVRVDCRRPSGRATATLPIIPGPADSCGSFLPMTPDTGSGERRDLPSCLTGGRTKGYCGRGTQSRSENWTVLLRVSLALWRRPGPVGQLIS